MTWKKTDLILKRRMNQHGLGTMVTAGQFCRQAELIMPDLFEAISFRGGILHLKVHPAKQMAFKMVEGSLFSEINAFAADHQMPAVTKIRLTVSE